MGSDFNLWLTKNYSNNISVAQKAWDYQEKRINKIKKEILKQGCLHPDKNCPPCSPCLFHKILDEGVSNATD